MATQQEVLQNLTFIEKTSYKEIIDVALKEYGGKNVLFTMVSNFMIRSLNRTTAISEAFDVKYKNDDITSSYTVFQGILQNVGGQVPELDKTNGLLNMFVYGDARTRRELKRIIAELKKRNSLLMSQILSDIEKAKTDLTTLQSQIPT